MWTDKFCWLVIVYLTKSNELTGKHLARKVYKSRLLQSSKNTSIHPKLQFLIDLSLNFAFLKSDFPKNQKQREIRVLFIETLV